jgi:hypothetical protein
MRSPTYGSIKNKKNDDGLVVPCRVVMAKLASNVHGERIESFLVYLSFSCVSFSLLCCYCHYCSRVSPLPLSLSATYVYPFDAFFESSSSLSLFFFLWIFIELSLVLCFVLLLPIYGETINAYIHTKRKKTDVNLSIIKNRKMNQINCSFILHISIDHYI